ncbi:MULTISPECIES: penicillin acylase family protein [unclassified Streptomyces]|uniref:penicillin acylase family protein n=1 Tax=unclassified Streptomyces TaxID=2593676 RepID=UPI00116282C8|nr:MULTISPECIES: penicillin acylase family protein [unclassified Streptomyces]QDN56595.1 penicillin acylase family protein [Streptomyces sp. S1D4-20]QDN66773.1 penicillin acylase family protein [Streptomyces sp. S1D4-14]QDN77021.1 penicillin acylase family protein [Streptomyces sp. S1A1-7]QDO49179.1 penicillin acylase family protein [Streptomyces sp. RLB3-5]QDO59420.1 penicillin acylase family protein [Streptomyces sp. RLB1-8]
MPRRTPRTALDRQRTPRRFPKFLGAASICALIAALLSPLTQAAAADSTTALAANDYCGGQCSDILPPGQNGNATLAQILLNQAFGIQPDHAEDQLGPYNNLASGAATLTDAKINDFFNDASFGVASDQVASSTAPGGRTDVTIVRDKKTGVPHITGTTRYGTEYGAGYAAAQDRLWLMDVFRHVGRGQLTSFAGGASSNQGLEQEFWRNAPYTEADLQTQIDNAIANNGARGQQALADANAYIDGINAYIDASDSGRYFPGEYVLTGHKDSITNAGTIDHFKITDLVALASVIGSLFGSGGGGEVNNALSLLAAQSKYGVTEGTKVWESFRERNDPEAVLTVHNGESFPYASKPDTAQGEALPDAGSVTQEPLVYDRTGSAATAAATGASATAAATTLTSAKRGMSNALVVSGKYTASGHPIAVFGPQTGYFAPQLLMLQEIQGPGLSARGASFAGLSMYVELGRGQDYSWSATTSGQDIIDTYAVELCQDDYHYLYHGTCTAMDKVERTNSWKPTTADGTAAGSYRMQVYRTKYGPVEYRATVGGKKVAYTTLRSSYMHEADSIIGFQMLNDPDYVKSPGTFQSAVQHINYTFNWFYADSSHTAYYNSGDNPVRAAGVDAEFPVWAQAAYEWRNWDPTTNTASYTPPSAHPNSIDQDYYISWNNKQAKDYTTAPWGDGSVHRGNLLEDRVKKLVAAGGVTRSSLTKAMADAALADLRAEDVLPKLLKVINSSTVTDTTAAAAVTKLSDWVTAGAKRKETSAGSKAYANADAIRILDAWWPLLVKAEFQPGLGTDLYTAFSNNLPIDESPSAAHGPTGAHAGSSFQYGWWSYVDKDIRAVLGESVQGGLSQKYCGGGTLSACRDALISTLKTAAGLTAAQVYPGDDQCSAGDQWCADSIVQRTLGGIKHGKITWQNRPTYQQVVEYTSHR